MGKGSNKTANAKPAAERPRSFDEDFRRPDALDTLLRERCGGAINIRGIRFQLRYSVARAVELAVTARASGADAEGALQFEGLEDVDIEAGPSLRGLTTVALTGCEFVQVKTAQEPWGWHKLAGPLIGFTEILRTGVAEVQFRLVVNFPLRGDLERLARFGTLKAGDQKDIRAKLRKLFRKFGGNESEADRLLELMVIEQITEEDLQTRMHRALANLTGAADVAVLEAHEFMLAGQALRWAADRTRITSQTVSELTLALRDGLARSEHFTAVAHRLVGALAHTSDARPEDFFEGKRVRFGHIVESLDVRRPEWLSRITEAFTSAPVVVIRAPSGHGKSALAYRYALENWPQGEAIVTRSVQSEEEVGALEDYLRFRSELGLPVRVLIDAEYQTRHWPQVAAAVAALGGQVLVTVRVEDWSRYGVDALARREIIEPTLHLDEAERIFVAFRQRDRVHPSVSSAAWAFERLRPPHLILEFVYFITHGQMLEDRLRDQVRKFRRIGEDPRKTELLRITALSNALGAHVPVDALLRTVPLRDDPQEVLGSLLGEYLVLEDGMLGPVHWVRSEHLARILHEGGIPSVTSTALTAATLSPVDALRFLVANAYEWEGIDQEAFVRGLVERFQSESTGAILAITSGLFEAGERAYFEANRALFDEAHAVAGPGGLLLVESEVAPLLRVDILARMVDILGAKVGHIPALIELVDRMQKVPRGLALAGRFLSQIGQYRCVTHLSPEPSAELGMFLDWCALTGADLPAWHEARGRVIESPVHPGRSAEDIASLSQGLFRFDRQAFDAWFARHETDIRAMLQLATRSLSLRLIRPSRLLRNEFRAGGVLDEQDVQAEDSARTRADDRRSAETDASRFGPPLADVEIVFPVDQDEVSAKPHEQAFARLELLRRALPFVGLYCSRGDYLLPEGLEPPVDDTVKNVPRWNLPFPSDVEKNA